MTQVTAFFPFVELCSFSSSPEVTKVRKLFTDSSSFQYAKQPTYLQKKIKMALKVHTYFCLSVQIAFISVRKLHFTRVKAIKPSLSKLSSQYGSTVMHPFHLGID